MRWNRDTDFTISAIQALDPYLKDAKPIVFRQGFLPQPAVRLNAKRDSDGELRDGFLTSFVNVSHVQPITSIAEYASIVDGWIDVMSGIGLHARQLTIGGDLKVWRRAELEGITLRFWHIGVELGDVVLLWNAEDPSYMATDLGSGLERLRWHISRDEWKSVAFGWLANHATVAALDAVRTATLIVGSGILPAARGRGGAVRRMLRYIDPNSAALGLGQAVRAFHEYWELVTRLTTPWHETARILETEVAYQSQQSIPAPRSSSHRDSPMLGARREPKGESMPTRPRTQPVEQQ